MFNCKQREEPSNSSLSQESAGYHLGISPDVNEAARHAARMFKERYDQWLDAGYQQADTEYKATYFTLAIGGGNTVRAELRAMVELYGKDINWIECVRFFFLEDSSGEANWLSPEVGLNEDFIQPLSSRLIKELGRSKVARKLNMPRTSSRDAIAKKLAETLTAPLNMIEIRAALNAGNTTLARKLAKQESGRYQRQLQRQLGTNLAFHGIISGIGKDGTIGSLMPYNPQLKIKKAGVLVLEQENGAFRIVLNRGVFINADWVSLIISGSLKLKTLGRFEIRDSANFEQTVQETPLRILNETPEIASKVYIFADDRALHFDEQSFGYKENGEIIETKADVRHGLEKDGISILLLHGFMGLFTFINFLMRLPSAWTVVALRRGTKAKTLPTEDIFPHYAKNLRKIILKNWQAGRPSPVGVHSIAGIISDHLLLSVADSTKGPLPPFSKLNKSDQKLVEALRVGGIIHLASFAPSDVNHGKETQASLRSHKQHGTPLDFGGPDKVYTQNDQGQLEITGFDDTDIKKRMRTLKLLLKPFSSEWFINGVNLLFRQSLNSGYTQKAVAGQNTPFTLRIAGQRMLKKISFYGLIREIGGSQHNPMEYQRRHVNALDVILKYDIPYLSIIHQDDFLVSAKRHEEEHNYLLQQRLKKEKVSKEQQLKVPARFILLERDSETLTDDVLNPHLMLMSTEHKDDKTLRQITAAITRFVNENVARANENRKIRTLDSVQKWQWAKSSS